MSLISSSELRPHTLGPREGGTAILPCSLPQGECADPWHKGHATPQTELELRKIYRSQMQSGAPFNRPPFYNSGGRGWIIWKAFANIWIAFKLQLFNSLHFPVPFLNCSLGFLFQFPVLQKTSLQLEGKVSVLIQRDNSKSCQVTLERQTVERIDILNLPGRKLSRITAKDLVFIILDTA